MKRTIALFLGLVLIAPTAWPQETAPAPSPVPSQSSPAVPHQPILLPPPPLPCTMPGPAACAPCEDYNGSLLRYDPLLDGDPAPGWFMSFETDLVVPRFKYGLTATVDVGGNPAVVNVPLAPLDWTGAPRVELGYRFSQGYGDLLFSYRSLVSSGTQDAPNYDAAGNGSIHSRLNINTVDIDYASRENPLGSLWDVRWSTGLRLANLYLDSLADGLIRHENTSNYFFGGGPHAGLNLNRRLADTGWSLITKADAGVTVGRISQSYGQTLTQPGMPAVGGALIQRGSQALPMLHVQAGVGWKPPWEGSRLKFETGYELERWWCVGQLNDSNIYMWVQGLFFRALWNY